MNSAADQGFVLVTGANGHVGRNVYRLLRNSRNKVLAVDVDTSGEPGFTACDLTVKSDVGRLFQSHSIRAVIHLAALLPGAFQRDPMAGVDVNVNGSFELLRQAVSAGTRRFVFASSMSVYGSSFVPHPLTEDDPAAPDEPYGGCKRAVELVGETLSKGRAIEFVSLRIARVVGPGIRKTSSPWRSQIFDPPSGQESVQLPFGPEAMLSLVHVHDVARMLVTLVETTEMSSSVYNTPAEIWEARRLKELVEEVRGIRVELGQDGAHAGPIGDGSRFTREFGYQLQGLRDYLSDRKGHN